MIDRLKERILLDTEINNRCLQEDLPSLVIKLLNIWNEYNLELLSIIKSEQLRKEGNNEYGSTKKSK